MKRVLLMWRMMLGSAPKGTVMVIGGALSVDEVEQRVKEVMESPGSSDPNIVPLYPVLGHPAMRPDMGFIELVSFFLVLFS